MSVVDDFLRFYVERVAEHTRPFEGMEQVVDAIEQRGLRWGIVTNKRRKFTDPLVERLPLAQRAGCVVSGDTLERAKPHPDPLLHACRTLGVEPRRCLYVGDDRRDIEAGRSAGMRTVAAVYGYLPDDDDPARWGADGSIDRPKDLLDWL
jgi:phosphoglycolate phosphatase